MEENNFSEQVQITEPDENNQSSLAEVQVNSTDSASEPEIQNEKSETETNKNTTSIQIPEENSQEQKIMKEVFEKLNIKESSSEKENFVQDILAKEAFQKDAEIKTKNSKLKQIVNEDLAKIQLFVQKGVINPLQGQNLKNLVLKKAFDKYIQYGISPNNKQASISPQPQKYVQLTISDALNEFQNEKPEFFTKEGRKEVINYLKSGGINMGKDDLNQISTLIESVEKSAVERYLKQTAYEKNLQKANESAKQKLNSNAQCASGNSFAQRTFTRKQIGKMSSAEFIKNESQIMEQLRKGLIR